MKMSIEEVDAAIKDRHAICLSAGELVNVCADIKKRGYLNTVVDIALIDTPRDPYQYAELVIDFKGRLEKVPIVYSANISKLPFSASKLTDAVLYACDDMHAKRSDSAPVSYVYASRDALYMYISIVINDGFGGVFKTKSFEKAYNYADDFNVHAPGADVGSADYARKYADILSASDRWRLVWENKKLW